MAVKHNLHTERRSAERLPVAIPVFVRGASPHGDDFLEFTTALNVSATGMLVAMQRELPLGTRVELETAAANAPGRAAGSLKAALVRAVTTGDWRLCGFQFTEPLTAVETAFRV